MQVEQEFFVGIEDVGAGNVMTDRAFLEALTNVTNLHGLKVGQSIDDNSSTNMAWMVLNWHLEVESRPRLCETYVARTWAQKYSRAFALRDYEVVNEAGEVCARATSKWSAVDPECASLIRLTPEKMDPYGCEPDHEAFPGFKFANLARVDVPIMRMTEFTVCKSMIDGNNHVHNPMYLDLATEALPSGIDMRHFDTVEVAYRKEVSPHATVRLHYGMLDGAHYVFVRDADDEVLHAAIMLA